MAIVTEAAHRRDERHVYEVETAGSADGDAAPFARLEGWKVAIIVIAILAVLYTLYFTRAIALPLMLAVVLHFLFAPAVRRFNKWGLPSAFGAGIVLLLLVVLSFISAYMISGPATKWVNNLPENLRTIEHKIRSLRQPITGIDEASEAIENITKSESKDVVLTVQMQKQSWANFAWTTVQSIGFGALIMFVLLFLLLSCGRDLVEGTLRLLPGHVDQQEIMELGDSMERGISTYLRTFSLINIGLGTCIGLAMWAIGLPNPILWGVMAGLLNFIPYIGCVIGAVIVTMVGLLSFDTFGPALAAGTAYLAINTVEAYLITPSILGRSLHMNPILVFVSLVFWGWLWGVGGAILAIPILAIVQVFVAHYARLRNVGRFILSGD